MKRVIVASTLALVLVGCSKYDEETYNKLLTLCLRDITKIPEFDSRYMDKKEYAVLEELASTLKKACEQMSADKATELKKNNKSYSDYLLDQ